MWKTKLKHKITGEIVNCKCTPTLSEDSKLCKGEMTYYNPDDPRETYNIEEYDNIPLEPFELFGVECGSGWNCLIKPIFDYIEEYNKDKEEDDKIHVLQVKEKYASLRFYTDKVTEELDKMIDEAEDESYKICENCGSKEDVGMVLGGWVYTSCLECVKKTVAKRRVPVRWRRNSDDKIYWVNTDGTIELADVSDI